MTLALVMSDFDDRLRTAVQLVAAFVCSLTTAALLWRWLGARMNRDRWVRPNYRGEQIVAVSGSLVVAVGAVGAAAVVFLAYRSSGWFAYSSSLVDQERFAALEEAGSLDLLPVDAIRSPSMATATGAVAAVLALLAFGVLGFRDDTRGDVGAGGFVAHIGRSWRQRRPTTGVQKALGGGVAALLCTQIALFGNVSSLWSGHGWADGFAVMGSLADIFIGSHDRWELAPLLRGALIVALGANVLNLLDRAPGRSTKVALAWWLCGLVPAALVHPAWPRGFSFPIADSAWLVWRTPALWAAGAVGASVGLLRSELRERHMQGDVGVNATGAVLGLATVAMASAAVEWVLLAVLVALNLASERWSFSRMIDAVPPLRWLDRLGSPYR